MNEMVEKTTIGINALITLLIVGAGMVVPGFFDEPKYYCEARPEVGLMECDGFSKYVAENGKCLNPDGNKICREGWLLVTNDFVPDDVPKEEAEYYGSSKGDYECLPNNGGCVEI